MEVLPTSLLEEIVLFLSINEIYLGLALAAKPYRELANSDNTSRRIMHRTTGVYLL
jgi:hypothetical protein